MRKPSRRSPAGLVTLLIVAATLLAQMSSYTAAQTLPNDLEPPVRFDRHQVVRVEIGSQADLDTMLRISPDVWSHHIDLGAPADFRIPPDALGELDASGLRYTVLIPDLQSAIEAERHAIEGVADNAPWFENYHTYDEIKTYYNDLVALRPDLVERLSIGTSIEGREIFGIRITGPGGGGARPAVLYNGCQHAREWVATMVPTFIADTLIRQYDNDPEIKALLDRVEFIIVPVVNPDGYVYSWTTNRMWRKNRRESYGVDLNRNWGFGWGGPGSSGNRSSQTYRGEFAFSEPETAAMRDFVLANTNINAHIDIHSYSQLFLQPWGYTGNLPPDHAELDKLGGEMSDLVLSVHGKFYEHGPAYTVLYPASGISPDWTYGDQGIFGFTLELRDTGTYGFLLPPEQIIPNSEEILPAALHLAQWATGPAMALEVDPLIAGQTSTARVDGADANIVVYFIYSLNGIGSTFVPPLGVTLDLASPKLAGSAQSGPLGQAELNFMIPPGVPNIDVWIQAAHLAKVSNVVAMRIGG